MQFKKQHSFTKCNFIKRNLALKRNENSFIKCNLISSQIIAPNVIKFLPTTVLQEEGRDVPSQRILFFKLQSWNGMLGTFACSPKIVAFYEVGSDSCCVLMSIRANLLLPGSHFAWRKRSLHKKDNFVEKMIVGWQSSCLIPVRRRSYRSFWTFRLSSLSFNWSY